MTKIALLGSIAVPTVGYFAAALREFGLRFDIILNEKVESSAALDIWNKRTEGAMPPLEINGDDIININRFSSFEAAEKLKKYDVALNGGTLEIFKGNILTATKLGIVNIHPGILPKYRGCTCVEWALYNNDPVGITAHLIDAGIDTGPVLETREIDTSGLTYPEIRRKIFSESFRLGAEVLPKLLTGQTSPREQVSGQYWPVIPESYMSKVTDRPR